MSAAQSSAGLSQLIPHLQTILRDLRTEGYPPLESPPDCKRASVAFIIRVNPSYAHWPASSTKNLNNLESFFEQDWVQYGEPEVLFIKRASRKGDRWTSHIALPGGRRDPEDKDDQAAAVRESWEEVGVDLDKYALECGNLPQRIVTAHWGKKPLLVLCPYVFLLTTHEIPPLKLQPSEVASTHWVPLSKLLAPTNRTVVFEDVSSRLANQETGVRKWMLSMILGQMQFAAIHLVPTESLHSVESPAEEALQDNRYSQLTYRDTIRNLSNRLWRSDVFNQFPRPRPEGPLLLWGLTLGAVSDFLDLVPPQNALELWTYPNFTPLDVRFAVWLMTYRFKNRKRAELHSGSEFRDIRPSFGTASESGVRPIEPDVSASTVFIPRSDETGLHGLGTGSGAGDLKGRKAAVQTMLEGYYDLVRRAVAVALVGRASLAVVLAVAAWKRFYKR